MKVGMCIFASFMSAKINFGCVGAAKADYLTATTSNEANGSQPESFSDCGKANWLICGFQDLKVIEGNKRLFYAVNKEKHQEFLNNLKNLQGSSIPSQSSLVESLKLNFSEVIGDKSIWAAGTIAANLKYDISEASAIGFIEFFNDLSSSVQKQMKECPLLFLLPEDLKDIVLIKTVSYDISGVYKEKIQEIYKIETSLDGDQVNRWSWKQ